MEITEFLLVHPYVSLAQTVFMVWMLVDAYRRQVEYYWFFIILFVPALGSWAYFFAVKIGDFQGLRDLALGGSAGLACGAALCILLTRSLENVGTVNAITTGVAALLIAATGLAAAFLPALRIMRVDPAEVLRS
jgi:ABC-type antimicrobial peptide transport system permease subunit